VLKIAPPSAVEVLTYERGAMATELAALRLIRERITVPVPTRRRYQRGPRPHTFNFRSSAPLGRTCLRRQVRPSQAGGSGGH
jgi:hypothetical protein